MTFNTDSMHFEDSIQISDIIERIEELETECDGLGEEDCSELVALTAIMDDLKGNGGDEQWRGDWYPSSLIRESYFKDYAQELAEDIGAVDANASWPNNCIDWEYAARELKYDYTSTEINGVTYLYR